MIECYRRLLAVIGVRLQQVHYDDRGEIPSNVAWVGGMVLLAVTLVGIISGKAQDFANNIDFGP